jgi:hypothetical protein
MPSFPLSQFSRSAVLLGGLCVWACTSFVIDVDETRIRKDEVAPAQLVESAAESFGVRPVADASTAASANPVRITNTVILISVDGLASRYLEQLIAAGRAPSFERLQRDGAFTHNARTEARITVTLPNHTSMLTGRPAVEVPDAPLDSAHGILVNYDLGDGATVHNSGNTNLAYAASIFDEIHDRGGYTSLYAGKSKFLFLRRSYSGMASRLDVIGGVDNGRNKVDGFDIIEDSASLVVSFLSSLEDGVGKNDEGPNFAFLHLRDPDSMGHTYGWGSDNYLAAVEYCDILIGGVLDTVRSTPELAGSTLIVTTDHGGIDTGHYDTTLLEVARIPFYVWGGGISAGADLYQLSDGTRVDPLESIPMDNLPGQPIRNGDAANLALSLMGLPAISGALHAGFHLAPPRSSAAEDVSVKDGSVDSPEDSRGRDASLVDGSSAR